MSKLSNQIGVVQVFLSKLEFKVVKSNEQKKSTSKQGVVQVQQVRSEAPKDKILIQANLPISDSEHGYEVSMTVTGVFIIDKGFEEKIKDINGSKIDKETKGLLNRIAATLMNKFTLVSALLSTEVSNFPVFPKLKADIDSESTHKKQ